mgnify:CR=1 FL=1
MRSMEMSAKTVEAAVEAACEALGVDRDDIHVSYEVLEFPARKLFKTIPAKVLVKVEEPEPAPVEEVKPAEAAEPAEVVEISDETAPALEQEVVDEMVAEADDETEIPLDIAADPRLQAAVDYLSPIFNLMGVENFTLSAVKKGAATILKVSGEHMGALIGRRGETLDAIQQLTNYSINRGGESKRARVQIDAENYREKREESLERLAQKVAGKVVKYRRNVTLEPMNAYERHVIHTALQDTQYITTFSIGTEPNRRVVVSYDRTKQ